jgi:aryl-phospho-beta-D-glucosidase BglC (GH1 family)
MVLFSSASLFLLLVLYTLPRLAFAFGFPYGPKPVRGVNLGGWLVLEVRPPCPAFIALRPVLSPRIQPWITPSLFDNTGNDAIVDEYTFCQFQSVESASAALHKHWDTWITEDDFAAIAGAGYVSLFEFCPCQFIAYIQA